MPTSNQDPSEVTEALNRLSAAMEGLQTRYDASERATRRMRIALVIVFLLLGGAMYKAIQPIAEQMNALPQILRQALPGLKKVTLDPETAAAERQRLMESLAPEEFEEKQKWVSDYIAASEDFDPGATIALFLSDMATSIQVMPELHRDVRAMTDQVRDMNNEIRTMNEKMSSIPILATEVRGINEQMRALPVLATDVKGMHFYMSIMAKDLDATMGEAGRMMPWNW
jgi:hypothetical protein